MAPMDESWMDELLEMFRVEGVEHLKVISSGLMELENQTAEDADAIKEVVYREAHSLKGAARSIGLTQIENVCQVMENVVFAYKRNTLQLSAEHFDGIHAVLDALELHIREDQPLDMARWAEVLNQIMDSEKTAVQAEAEAEVKPVKPKVTRETLHKKRIETLKVPVERMDRLMEKAEAMLGSKLAIDQLSEDLKHLLMDLSRWKEELELQQHHGGEKENRALSDLNAVAFHESVMDRVLLMESRLGHITQSADTEARHLTSMVDRLSDSVKSTLMLPFDHLLKIMPKTVRDVAQAQGKRVNITQKGGHIEIDRRILEALKDPLIHLLRNSVDHGIEPPEQRRAAGKDEVGQIGLTITPADAGAVEIRLWDDGKGIDAQAVRNAAVKKGLIDQESADALSEEEARQLIFLSEMSTSPTVNMLSGRGLGLAIVREKVDELGGTVILESTVGEGSVFRLIMPIKQANFRGIVVECSGQTLVMQTQGVERSGRIMRKEIVEIEGQKTITEAGQPIPYHDLAVLLGIADDTRRAESRPFQQFVVIQAQGAKVAFGVDEVLREQEILVKSLGRQLLRVRNVAGATILGNGHIAPILNGNDLVLSAQRRSKSARNAELGNEGGDEKSILVVEDSVTTRTLLKKVLSAAGYRVTTAVDGMDALSKLYDTPFDLMVSDVEMPRLNGLDLVGRLRARPQWQELPVVLVTGLDSRENKERGLSVGANGYLSKKGFNPHQLLSLVGQLI